MMRPATIIRDAKILILYNKGLKPERIKFVLGLTSVSVVYDARRRDRRKKEDRRTQDRRH